MKTRKICRLFAACLAFGVVSSSVYAACTPVVYIFRHAEDLTTTENCYYNPSDPAKSCLTPAGKKHAGMYKDILDKFRNSTSRNNDCKTLEVYALDRQYTKNGSTTYGSPNSYDTAYNLAQTYNPTTHAYPYVKYAVNSITKQFTQDNIELDTNISVFLKSKLAEDVGKSVVIFLTGDTLNPFVNNLLGTRVSLSQFQLEKNAAIVMELSNGKFQMSNIEYAQFYGNTGAQTLSYGAFTDNTTIAKICQVVNKNPATSSCAP